MRMLLSLATVVLIAYPIVTTGQQPSPAPKSQGPTIVAANPSRLTLEVAFFPGRPPAYQTLPGSESKRAGACYGVRS